MRVRFPGICVLLALMGMGPGAFGAGNVTGKSGSILSPRATPEDVYVCSVIAPSAGGDGGRVKLRVERCLTSSDRRSLNFPYRTYEVDAIGREPASREEAIFYWPGLAAPRGEEWVLCAVDHGAKSEENPGGVVTDVFRLSGPEDPLVDEFRRIVKLQAIETTGELKRYCLEVLNRHEGSVAMRACANFAVERLAKEDADGALSVILVRMKSVEEIDGEELDKEIRFLNRYLDEHPHAWQCQQMVDVLVPFLTAMSDELAEHSVPAWADRIEWRVLRLLARAVDQPAGMLPAIGQVRRGALRGALEAMRERQNAEVSADIRSVLAWLKVAPKPERVWANGELGERR